MRVSRATLTVIFLYLSFLGGGAYYALSFEIRVLHHVIMTISLLAWLFVRFRQNKGLPLTGLNTPLLFACAGWLISAAFSIDPRMSFEHVWLNIVHVLLFFYLVSLIQRGWQRGIFEAVFMMASLAIFLGALQFGNWYFGWNILPSDLPEGWVSIALIPPLSAIPPLTLGMGISTLLAGYVAPLLVLAIGWAFTVGRRDYQVTLWLMAVCLMLVLILTGSRGGLLSVLIAGGVVVLYQAMRYVYTRRWLRPAGLAIVGIVIVLIYGIAFLRIALPSGAQSLSDRGRVDMLESGIAIFADYPLTGVGPGLFGRAFRSYRDPAIVQDKLASAHNLPVNIASELGIMGLVIAGLLVVWFLRLTFRNWRQAVAGQQTRIIFVVAALAGLMGHSLVDVFSITPVVLIMLVLVAYAITPLPATRLVSPAHGQKPALLVLAGLVAIYGILWIQSDRAQSLYINSLRASDVDEALNMLDSAQEIDPYLNLYTLHRAYLVGIREPVNLQEAITAYETALTLEPTWDTGWLNLAHYHEMNGDPSNALSALTNARAVSLLNPAWLHWARVAEQYSEEISDEDIIQAYMTAMRSPEGDVLPVTDFWTGSALRITALRAYAQQFNSEVAYRLARFHPEQLVLPAKPLNPESSQEFWLVGQLALDENDYEKALEAFSTAIIRTPNRGDLYASRARAILGTNPDQAKRDLLMARALRTYYEYPHLIAYHLAQTDAERTALAPHILPMRIVRQEFAAVLYSRPAVFDIIPAMRFPGYNDEQMQPWFQIAQNFIASENWDSARNALSFINDHAPFSETVAQLRAQLP